MNNADVNSALSLMQVRGFCIIANVISPDSCVQIQRSVIKTVERERQNYPTAPTNVGFVPSIINHDQSFAEYLASAKVMAVVRRLLGEHIRISFTSAIINEPGNERGSWHADWPFNQKNAGHIPAPYPDTVMHLTTLWMLSPFEVSNGGTLVYPGSHRLSTNPTAPDGIDPRSTLTGEVNIAGPAGSVLVMDSRLWHATAPNNSDEPRVALAVRYAPWWLNLEVLRPESDERARMCDESGKSDNIVPSIRQDVFDRLPDEVRPLYRHWVASH